MISCDDCQKKVMAVLDSEAGTEDERLVSAHLADCPKCRKFHDEMISTRQLLGIAAAARGPVTIGQDFMWTVEADALRSKKLSGQKTMRIRVLSRYKLPRVVWASGVAAAVLIVVSWLACYALAKQVADVKGRLRAAQQDLAVVRAEKRIEEDREKEQEAITALYLRMAELEERVEGFASPRTTFVPAGRTSASEQLGQM